MSGYREAGWTPELLGKLRCPHCIAESGGDSGTLTLYQDAWLIAPCGRKYPIADGIPVMLIEEGERWMEVEPERLPARPPTS